MEITLNYYMEDKQKNIEIFCMQGIYDYTTRNFKAMFADNEVDLEKNCREQGMFQEFNACHDLATKSYVTMVPKRGPPVLYPP